MRKLQAAEEEQKRKLDAKAAARLEQKKQLLESFQRQKQAAKAEKKEAKKAAEAVALKKADTGRKRVSFSPEAKKTSK